jgi:hypothetical protein
MKKIKPGYYIDWSNDLLVVYPDMSFEYWGDYSNQYEVMKQFFYSKDSELLNCFINVPLTFLGKL